MSQGDASEAAKNGLLRGMSPIQGKAAELLREAQEGCSPAPADRVFTIWVCPACGHYDADPILRRGPGSRHGPKRCSKCASRAEYLWDRSRIAPSYRSAYHSAFYDQAPLMVATRVVLLRAVKNEEAG